MNQDTYILLIQLFPLIIGIYIAFTKKINRVYIADLLLNVSLLLCYLSISDVATMIVYISEVLRSTIYIYRNKFKTNIIPWLFIASRLIIGFLTIESSIQIISVVFSCWVCYYLWYWGTSTQKIRIGNVINNSGWALYNSLVGLWIIVVMRLIVVGANLVSIFRNKNILKTIK